MLRRRGERCALPAQCTARPSTRGWAALTRPWWGRVAARHLPDRAAGPYHRDPARATPPGLPHGAQPEPEPEPKPEPEPEPEPETANPNHAGTDLIDFPGSFYQHVMKSQLSGFAKCVDAHKINLKAGKPKGATITTASHP